MEKISDNDYTNAREVGRIILKYVFEEEVVNM
jgi:hypothetical protein